MDNIHLLFKITRNYSS